MTKMKRGDLVQLKSGGPVMTVMELGVKKIRCGWFDDHRLMIKRLPIAVLRKTDSELHDWSALIRGHGEKNSVLCSKMVHQL